MLQMRIPSFIATRNQPIVTTATDWYQENENDLELTSNKAALGSFIRDIFQLLQQPRRFIEKIKHFKIFYSLRAIF